MTKILIEIDTDTQRVVPVFISEEMHIAAFKVLLRATGIDGTPQRMLDAICTLAPQPDPVDADLRRDAELWRAHQKRKQDLIDRGFLRNPLRAAPQDCLAEIVTIDASMLSQGEQK